MIGHHFLLSFQSSELLGAGLSVDMLTQTCGSVALLSPGKGCPDS